MSTPGRPLARRMHGHWARTPGPVQGAYSSPKKFCSARWLARRSADLARWPLALKPGSPPPQAHAQG
eukprot:5189348-Alexandrium_andersonii.AAC.1